MAVNTARIAEVYQEYGGLDPTTEHAIRVLLVESLQPRQRQVYEHVSAQDEPISARDIADHFGMEINQAGTILKALCKLRLMKRKAIVTESRGLEYWYE